MLAFYALGLCSFLLHSIYAGRPKETDEYGEKLTPFEYITGDCSYFDYAIIDDSLERCDKYKELDEKTSGEYEQLKCDSLRVHAKVIDGKCECDDDLWRGPLCHYRHGCPEKQSYLNGVCVPNLCQHDGILAIGSKQIECQCPLPWDGRWCERLACWRMADETDMEVHWRNRGDKCECDDGYEGLNCEYVNRCDEGNLADGTCYCNANYTGDFCQTRCGPGTTVTCGASILQSMLLLALTYSFILLSVRK